METEEKKYEIRIEEGLGHWDINHTGNHGGTYLGTFSFRLWLDPYQEIAADREYREFLGANPSLARQRPDDLAYALAQLKQRVVKAPPFWGLGSARPGAVADQEVVIETLNAAIEAELAHRRRMNKMKEEALERIKRQLEKRDSEKASGGDKPGA